MRGKGAGAEIKNKIKFPNAQTPSLLSDLEIPAKRRCVVKECVVQKECV
jgi:hypothetical protein